MRRRFTRRTLLGGAAGASVLFLPSARAAFSFQSNERIGLAVLGNLYVAGHFFSSLHAYPDVELVAIANPDERKFAEAYKVWKEQADNASSARPEERGQAEYYRRLLDNRPPAFADFREMLDERGGAIDAVVVSMFEHYHGVACGEAMRAGKHVFCERPLGRTVRESRALRDLAAETKLATSIRNPGNASNAFRRGVELVREGAIGAVEEVHVWFDRAGPDRDGPPRGTPPLPAGLHWDLWLGPLEARPYHEDWLAYATWRETSNGGVGTFGPHAANLAFAALDLHDLWKPPAAGSPSPTIRISADCPRRNRLSFPQWEVVRWKVPARGGLPPVNFTWHHGKDFGPGAKQRLTDMITARGATKAQAEKLLGYAGAMLVGSKGVLVTDDHNVKFALLPEAGFRDVQQAEPKALPRSRGHYHDWFHAVRGGAPAWSNFEYANPLSEFLMLANVATQFEGELEYNPVAARVPNHAEADKALGYTYRGGWKI